MTCDPVVHGPRTNALRAKRKALRRGGAMVPLLLICLVAGLFLTSPAEAENPWGVKYVEARGELATSSFGRANTIFVHQSQVDGDWKFDRVETTSPDPNKVWMHVDYSAGCRTGYRLFWGRMEEGNMYSSEWGFFTDFDYTVLPGRFATEFGLPKKKNHSRVMDIHPPLEAVLEHTNSLGSADPIGELLAEAEAMVQTKIDGGMTEYDARAETVEVNTAVDWHSVAACEKLSLFRQQYFLRNDTPLPLRIVFVGVQPEQGIGDSFEGGGLIGEADVTQAVLSVQADTHGRCVVHANGTFVTNQPVRIDYRLVNNQGEKSRLFSVDVDHTLVAHVTHEVAVPEALSGGSGDTLTANQGHSGIGDNLAQEGSENVSDVFHFEIVSPHFSLSNSDGYSIPPCVAVPEGGVDSTTNELVVQPSRGNEGEIQPIG